jgi:DNA-binding transcriptional MerR regulator
MNRVQTMLVSELADRADIPVATVKYYLREGLLPPGEMVGPRRAEYGEVHLRRLRVLRALREVGGAPVSTLQVIVDAIEDASRPSHEVLCEISDALSPPLPDEDYRPDAELGGCVDAAIEAVGWSGVRTDAAARSRLAEVVQLGGADLLTVNPEILGYYAHLADELCRTELQLVDLTKDRQGTLEDMVVGEAVFGEILALFRRLGHEHYDERREREGAV